MKLVLPSVTSEIEKPPLAGHFKSPEHRYFSPVNADISVRKVTEKYFKFEDLRIADISKQDIKLLQKVLPSFRSTQSKNCTSLVH